MNSRVFSLPLLSAVALSAFTSLAPAELTFTEKELSHEAKADETEFTGVFAFKNTGKEKVTIKKVTTSCGCTTAELKKKVYEPGESGELPVVFTYGDFQGFQHKSVAVETNEQTYQLSIDVEIPEFVKFDRPFLSWEQQDELTPQSLLITVASDAPFKIVDAEFENPDAFTGELKELESKGKSRQYSFTVTPKSTEKYAKSLITFKTDLKAAKPRMYKAFCMVKPKVNEKIRKD